MEKSGEVDLSVIPAIENVLRYSGQRGREARKSGNSREQSFVMYHAWRNIEIIASNIKTRFENSSKGHDNPQVALDALCIVPELRSLATLMLALDDKKIDLKTRMLVLDQVSMVRDTARKCNFSDQSKDELDHVTRAFSKDLAKFVSRV